MLKWIKRLIFGKNLNEVLGETKTVKIHGIKFTIRKLDAVHFLDGSKVLAQVFDTYKVEAVKDKEKAQASMKKVKEYWADVFLASVVSPVLVRKKEDAVGEAILVDNLFTEWDLVNELYAQIILFTYGKKKLRQSTSRASA